MELDGDRNKNSGARCENDRYCDHGHYDYIRFRLVFPFLDINRNFLSAAGTNPISAPRKYKYLFIVILFRSRKQNHIYSASHEFPWPTSSTCWRGFFPLKSTDCVQQKRRLCFSNFAFCCFCMYTHTVIVSMLLLKPSDHWWTKGGQRKKRKIIRFHTHAQALANTSNRTKRGRHLHFFPTRNWL